MDCVSVMPNAKRVKIALMTPELARNGGQIEASKAMAFGGSNVSVDLTWYVCPLLRSVVKLQ